LKHLVPSWLSLRQRQFSLSRALLHDSSAADNKAPASLTNMPTQAPMEKQALASGVASDAPRRGSLVVDHNLAGEEDAAVLAKMG